MNAAPTIGLFRWLMRVAATLPQYVVPILLFSVVANVLLLVSPFYMLQVYDRILTSGSIDTLIWLTVISVFLLGIYAAAEVGRRRLSTLAANEIDELLSKNAFLDFGDNPEAGDRLSSSLRYMARIRGYFSNQSVLPFFDLPFAPMFLAVLFLIHPIIGLIGLCGAALMLGMAMSAEMSTRSAHDLASLKDSEAFELALGLSRQRSAIVSMGLTKGALAQWRSIKAEAQQIGLHGSKREIGFASSSKSVRQMLQILVLGAGGALAVRQQVSPGAIVAGSIILGRALAPIDQVVGGWRGIAAIRQAWAGLGEAAFEDADVAPDLPLPRPKSQLTLERLTIAPPGAEEALVRPFGLTLQGGDVAALIGAIGCGKTSLLQTISGAWRPYAGHVHLGGRDLHEWDSDDRGPYVGYVPQKVELLPGTIAQNIARMGEAEGSDIIAAAEQAGAHEMVLALPKGYDTRIGMNGQETLSAGQQQLVGLARALFGAPVLLILDEPTANLDEAGRMHAIKAIQAVAARGGIVVIATHDTRLLQTTGLVLAIRNGAVVSADTQRYLASLSKTDPTQQTIDIAREGSVG